MIERLERERELLGDNIADLEDVIKAVEAALKAVQAGEQEKFAYEVGIARGRLTRLSARLYDPGWKA
jgi:hypothetical protein